MARPKNPVPAYLLHKATGKARVRLKNGSRYRDVYLGEYGSPESYEEYRRVVAEHLGDDGPNQADAESAASSNPNDWTVAELAVKYDDFASIHYVKNGESTDDRYRAAIGPLATIFGSTLAKEFGPKKLKALREAIIHRGNLRTAEFDIHGNLTKPGEPLGRGYVNNLMKSVIRMFKWAVTEEKVSPSVPEALRAVGGLRKGRDRRVREPEPIRPVPEEHFRPAVDAASSQIATMMQVQRLAGMRPDEVTIIRPCDIDRNGDVWIYRPDSHKLEWLDQEKEILLGPQAQELLTPWLDGRKPTEYLFSPREVAEANARELEKRRKRPSSKKVRLSKKRPPREHYDDRGYRQAVIRACNRAGVPEWSPGRLRHSAGTDIRCKYGVEAAQLVLGHKKLSTTEIYAEKNREKYERIMLEIG
ncbi:MAG: tyrosine-type recombinase/integrase [Planctomycetota bacterium]|nr:tyrosine-type recombinase/integrase [Planctomycetota bacterium]